jgi:hypothetical protein
MWTVEHDEGGALDGFSRGPCRSLRRGLGRGRLISRSRHRTPARTAVRGGGRSTASRERAGAGVRLRGFEIVGVHARELRVEHGVLGLAR